MSLSRRIMLETAGLARDPPPGCTIQADEHNARLFYVRMRGPNQSPYEGGIFKLEMFLPDGYPLKPPRLRFLTKVYHPNVDSIGRVCLDVLREQWSPALQMRTVLLSVRALLAAPNPHDPLANDVAKQWIQDQEKALTTAKEWTLAFAEPDDQMEREEGENRTETENCTSNNPECDKNPHDNVCQGECD